MVRANRGRGNRRGGRGRGRSRRHYNTRNNVNVSENIATEILEESSFDWNLGGDDVTTDGQLRKLFLNKSKFSSHYEAQNKYPVRYYACLHVLIRNNVQLLESSKALALAAAWAQKDYTKSEFLLQIPGEKFGIKEVLKALTILDSARNKRAHEKLLKRLEAQGCKKRQKMVLLKSMIGSIEAEIPPTGSLSGALIRHVKLWLRTIPVDRLEFYAMHFPPDPWKKLADLCHLHPEKDFPQCPWFLPFCFGKTTPEGILASEKSDLTEENISERVLKNDIDYTVARKWHSALTDEAKERIATYSKLDTVLWYYEELGCKGVDKVINKRLKDGEKLDLPYGKLMERIMFFERMTVDEYHCIDLEEDPDAVKPKEGSKKEQEFVKILLGEAETRLKDLRFNLEAPVVVIGDMSGSMNVAIRTSNIIASLVTAVTSAELVFFDTENVVPSFVPKDVDGVLRLCDEIKARGGTAPAVSLYPYYEKKKIIKTFVIVTDEGENRNHEGYSFDQLFKKYYDEVYPARLVFISFLRQTDPGQMVNQLKGTAPEIKPMQFRFDGNRPDLTKLDNVFGLLSSENVNFSKEIDEIEKLMTESNMAHAIQLLKL